MNDERVDPEKLLARVQEEERQETRGKLKIYLGSAPGVGKTYTMLKDAKDKSRQGLDVVIGVVESHGRQDIENLLIGLEILPSQKIEYRGKILEEFDLDEALLRHPGLILMDEMAHSNADGLRHAKRWQDIKELLDRGINVYTTLNVQHIESLNDDVSSIIHAPVKETVPDLMLELADTIELIDLPPEDLLKRLEEGKVYFPEQASVAAANFFRKGNLIALRELALRITAERVSAQVLLYRQGLGIKHIWSTNEKILVCVGHGSEALHLIRSARRLATSIQSEWIAVHVDCSRQNLTDDQRNKVIRHLQVASRLGAETVILNGFDVVKTIMSYAREQNITLIMVWKLIRERWKDLFHFRLADELVRNSQEINVYIMTGSSDGIDDKIARTSQVNNTAKAYAVTVGIVIVVTILCFLLSSILDSRSLILIYLVGITIVALYGKIGPSILASVLSVGAYAIFFLPGAFSFSFSEVGYLSTLLIMILLTQVISHLTFIARRQALAARTAERHTAALHKLSKQLAGTRGVDKLLTIGTEYISDVFNSEVMSLKMKDSKLRIIFSTGPQQTLDPKDLSVAQWVFDLGQKAGLGTDTLPLSDAMYVPLIATQGTMGVLRIRPKNPKILFSPDQMNFLETCVNQIALTIEVDNFQEQRKKTELKEEVDHTRNLLLQSVSQDLRSPLAAIMLAASTQMQLARNLTADQIRQIALDIYTETEQLSRLINNLLQITYLESNAISLHKTPSSLKELVSKVLNASRKKMGNTPVYINIPNEIPDLAFDQTLMEGVFVNLLDNSLKFAPKDKPIEISAILDMNKVIVSVEDQGPGIFADEENKLFEKFYRGRMLTTQRGLGLGLAICKMIIEAHGGTIWAENRAGGGSAFRFTLLIW